MIAIIPAAGKGKRMAPVTGGAAKEMLDVGGKPVIEYALREAITAEVDQIVLVSAPNKDEVNDYFSRLDYPKQLVIQPEPTGLAAAVLLAGMDDDAVVILPDTIYTTQPAARIGRALKEGYDIVLFTERVADSQVKQYGIYEPERNRILEKPLANQTESRRAIGGRLGFSSQALKMIAISVFDDPKPDLPLTPGINFALEQGLRVVHLEAEQDETRYDCGSISGYKRALKELA